MNIKIGTKLVFAFLIVIGFAVWIGLDGIKVINLAKIGQDQMYQARYKGIAAIWVISRGQASVVIGQRGLLNRRIIADKKLRQSQYDYINKWLKKAEEGKATYKKILDECGTEENKKNYQDFDKKWTAWKSTHETFIGIVKKKVDLLNKGMSPKDPVIDALDTKMYKQLLDAQKEWLDTEVFLEKMISEMDKQTNDLDSKFDKDTTEATDRVKIALIIGIIFSIFISVYFVFSIRGILNGLVKETNLLLNAAANGELDKRANASLINFEFRGIAEGINKMLDALISPLNVAANYVDSISKGKIPPHITDEYKGNFNKIKENLNKCIDAVNMLIRDAGILSEAAIEGKLSTRANADMHEGDFRKIVQGVNETLDAVIGPLNVAANYVDNISKGNIPAKISDNYNGDFNTIKNNLNVCIDAVNALVADAAMLSDAAVAGKLSTRADVDKHQGDFKRIVKGVNDTLDSVIGPLTVAANYVDMISKGNIPAKIDDNYNGDFNTIKNNLNVCIDAVNALVADANKLSDAAVAGKLATRADAAKHQGDFKKIVEGVNNTLDAIVLPVNEASEVLTKLSERDLTARMTGDYAGDFAKIKINLNNAMDSLENTVKDVLAISIQVADSAVQVSTASESVGKASQEVANGAQQVASGSTETSRSSNEAANNMEQLQRAIEEVARGAQVQATGAEQAALAAQQSQVAIKKIIEAANNAKSDAINAGNVATESAAKTNELLESMDRVKEAATITSNNVNALGDASKKIGEIVEAINDIAEQTNLLALNAAIEAARAGEHGKGFAVVADEVRKLAERSAGQTKEIASLIRGIQEEISEAVSSMSVGSKEIDAGVGMANNAGEALKSILKAVDKVIYQANEVGNVCVEVENNASLVMSAVENVSSVTEESTAATEEMAASSTEVTKAIEQVAAVTQQSSATSEELSAAAEEQNALVEEMTAASKEMSMLSGKAKNILNTFNVR
jgi:methyl-accepting chemotaxis protein